MKIFTAISHLRDQSDFHPYIRHTSRPSIIYYLLPTIDPHHGLFMGRVAANCEQSLLLAQPINHFPFIPTIRLSRADAAMKIDITRRILRNKPLRYVQMVVHCCIFAAICIPRTWGILQSEPLQHMQMTFGLQKHELVHAKDMEHPVT